MKIKDVELKKVMHPRDTVLRVIDIIGFHCHGSDKTFEEIGVCRN